MKFSTEGRKTGCTCDVTGPGGLPIEQIAQGNVVRYFNRDQLGSTTGMTTSTGAGAQTYKYDAYGQLTSAKTTVPNPFRYAGQYTDPETGLQYLRARYYDPASGQMLSRDPVTLQTRQPYAYANNDPTDQTDPTGLYSLNDLADDATGTIGEVDDVIKNGQSAQFLGNEILGAANTLSFGTSNSLLGINGDCLGVAGDIGGALGLAVPGGGALKGVQFLRGPARASKSVGRVTAFTSRQAYGGVAVRTEKGTYRFQVHKPHHGSGNHIQVDVPGKPAMYFPRR